MDNEKKELIDELIELVKDAKANKDLGATWIHQLDYINEKRWAIVFGYEPGYSENEDDEDYYQLCGKVAYQSSKCIMQEYEWDWTMPYSEKTGDVDVTETSIGNDIKGAVEYLVNEWYRIKDIYPYSYYEILFGSGTAWLNRYVVKVDEDTTDYGALTDCLIDYLAEHRHNGILDQSKYVWNDEGTILVSKEDEREVIYSDEFVQGGNCGDVLLHYGEFSINPISAMDIGDAEIVEVD